MTRVPHASMTRRTWPSQALRRSTAARTPTWTSPDPRRRRTAATRCSPARLTFTAHSRTSSDRPSLHDDPSPPDSRSSSDRSGVSAFGLSTTPSSGGPTSTVGVLGVRARRRRFWVGRFVAWVHAAHRSARTDHPSSREHPARSCPGPMQLALSAISATRRVARSRSPGVGHLSRSGQVTTTTRPAASRRHGQR